MKSTRKFSAWILLFSIFLNQIMTGVNASNLDKKILPSGLKYSDLPRTIENYVNNHKRTTCGMNVIVYDRDGIIYENSFGYIDKESMVKSDLDSVYEWGSISKLMIWVSVMQLYEKGKLDLNVDIKNYLPENFLKNLSYDKPITMIDLMNHKAGFQDTYFIQTTDASEITTLEDALSIRSPKQVYEPGEHTAYSNWSAALAALIVQRVSGMDYVEYVHKNILKPLSMDHTSIGPKYDDNTWVKSERQKQKCYDIEGEEIGGKAMYYIHLFPAGSAAGTISDLQKFARALTPDDKNPSPLFEKKDTLKEIYSPTSFYGSSKVAKNYHGFFASEYKVETIGHGGNTFGFSSMLQFDPISGVGMVLMTNQAHETIYNYDMYEIIYGKFTDSKLSKIKRDLPKGLILNTRGIITGPLSFLGAMGVSSFSEEDLSNWWYEENEIVETQFSDFLVSSPKAVTNILCILVFIIAGIYGIINTLICGLILDPIKKKKGQAINSPIKKYSYIISSLMGLALINLFICFMRLNSGYRTGDIGSAFSYIIQSIIFAILLILMIIALIKAFKGRFDLATKKEKFKLFIIELLAVGQCMVIMIFDMYKFWAL